MPDIEPKKVGVYDDTQLEAIDQLMLEAHERGRLEFRVLRLAMILTVCDRYQTHNRHA